MRVIELGLLAIAVGAAYGYLDTSPFFMFSTSEILTPTSQLQSASSLTSDVSTSLSQCPSDFYIIVSQPGVKATDFSPRKAAPALSQWMSGGIQAIRSSASVAEVVGEVDTDQWQKLLQGKCGAQVTDVDATTGSIPASYEIMPRLFNVYFPQPSQARWEKDLLDNDAFLASLLDIVPAKNYTVLYTTTPGSSSHKLPFQEEKGYEMDTPIQEILHIGLKRDGDLRLRLINNQTLVDGPLFEKYQFFTPGIFMGLVVALPLLMILYVAVSGVASLKVSYAAFDKENGPAAQKKAQQG